MLEIFTQRKIGNCSLFASSGQPGHSYGQSCPIYETTVCPPAYTLNSSLHVHIDEVVFAALVTYSSASSRISRHPQAV